MYTQKRQSKLAALIQTLAYCYYLDVSSPPELRGLVSAINQTRGGRQ